MNILRLFICVAVLLKRVTLSCCCIAEGICSRCKHGATCAKDRRTHVYKCLCASGYTGKFCEKGSK